MAPLIAVEQRPLLKGMLLSPLHLQAGKHEGELQGVYSNAFAPLQETDSQKGHPAASHHLDTTGNMELARAGGRQGVAQEPS